MTDKQLAIFLKAYRNQLADAIAYAKEHIGENAPRHRVRKYVGPEDSDDPLGLATTLARLNAKNWEEVPEGEYVALDKLLLMLDDLDDAIERLEDETQFCTCKDDARISRRSPNR